DDPAPQLGTQPPCISSWEIGREHRDLERAVERSQELKPSERPAGVRGERDPWNNVQNFHVEVLAIPPRRGETCGPPDAAPRGASVHRNGCRPRPPDRSVR